MLESLETRRVLADFEVTSLLDTTNANDGVLTLREAIVAANGNTETDTITFTPDLFTGGFTSMMLSMGELKITDSVNITGPGRDLLAIDAKVASRVFNIEGTSIDVSLSGLTITGGRTTGDNLPGETIHSGGGIRFLSSGSLTITDSTVSANSTTGIRALGGGIYSSSGNVILQRSNVLGNSTAGYSAGGGGILTNSGNVTLTRSTLSDNRTTGEVAFGGGISTQTGSMTLISSTVADNLTTRNSGAGGGIYSSTGSVALTSSTVSGNSTAGDSSIGGGIFTVSASVTLTDSSITNNSTGGDSSGGGGIFAATGNVTLSNSTVSGNRTAGTTSHGGGIYARAGNVTLTGSTLSGNQVTGATSDGGGIWFDNSIVTILNSTITSNTASGAGGGLGLVANPTDKKLTIHNTIVAGNTAASDADFTAPTTPATNLEVKSSLIGNNAGTTLAAASTADANGNLIGTPTALLDAKLGPLALNGGTTQTHALLADSPAINAGDDSLVTGQINDQRGAPFGRKNDVVDIGAYELRTIDPSFFVVTTLNDELDYSNTAVSLREAINSTNGNVGTDTITFNFGFSGTIALSASLGQLPIANSLIINGNGANNTVVDAGKQGFRVIEVTGNSSNVTLSGMTLTGGQTTGTGGGINFDSLNGVLILNHSTLSDNSADIGGGLFNVGLATLNHSTLSGNSARRGGGIDSYRGVTLNHSTLSGNSAVTLGGGILNRGTTTLSNSTLSGNTANAGGGVYNNSTITLNNSTLSGNTSNRAGGGMFNNGTATLNNSTLAGNSAGTSGGGLYNNSGRTTTLNNSIVVGSLNGGDISGTVTGNANLIGNPNSAGGLVHGTSGNILGTDNGAGGRRLIDVATVLAPLAFNGGPTMTHALVPNSPAINKGSDTLVASTQINDQRGAPFVRKNGVVDIGAFELGTLDPSFFIVTTLNDELDYSNTDVSLREAINSANGNVGTDTITFDPSLFTSNAAIIFLELGELPITESIVIDGPGQDLLSINAVARSRVLNVIGGTAIDVSLEGLTLSGGRTTGNNQIIGSTLETTHSGGGIRFDSTGTLTLTGSTVSENSTVGTFARGGGIDTTSGTIALIRSNVSGNSTVAFGGGIHLRSGTLTLTDSTVSGNTTSGDNSYGGGIVNYAGPVTLTGSTVASNRTAGSAAHGAGIFTRSGEVKLTNSTIADNRTEGRQSYGGGIRTYLGTVTLIGSTVTGNRTTGDRAFGGGIYTDRGAITLTGSVISGNSTEKDSSRGGGVFNRRAEMKLTNSTVSGNTTAGQDAHGGGIYLDLGSTLTLTNSTVSGNSTSGEKAYGGGIYANFATVTLTNSTVSGNRVTGTDSDGGGIGLDSSVLTVVNSTITGNSATRAGGGMSVNARDSDKKLTIHNSIIAGNTAASAPDFTAPPTPATNLEVRFSLIGNNAGTSLTLPAADGNLIGTATAPIDPKLGPLATNGGLTQTHALLADSPAINKGSDALVDSTQINDQRGAPFGRKNGVVDMGAYELRTLDPSFFVVTTLNDELDYSNTAVSLREAIISANGNIGTDTITFNPSLFTSGAASIVLTRGELPVTESIVIDGPGQDLLTINANQLSRVMNILGGTAIDVNLEGMTLTGGRTTGNNQPVNGVRETTHSGGGIRFDSTGTLTLTVSTVSGNRTTGAFARGGGIDTTSGNLTLIGSTVSGNSTTGRESSGGGIHSRFGNVKLTDSTISGNSTSGTSSRGGGLYTRYGNAEITRSTISGNSTIGGGFSYGGGIYMYSGALVMNESTVSNNSTTGDGAFGGGIRMNSGTVTLSGTTVSDNFTTGGYASGGGIFTLRGAVTLANSIVSGNRTTGRDADGGGIYSIQGEVTLTNSTISGNSTTGDFAGGGGVYVRIGALTLTRSTVSGNRTSGRYSHGGGIYSRYDGATLTLTGSTISGNQVTGTDSDGGGVGLNNSVVTILNSTISGNSATRAGGGLGIFVDQFDKKLTIHNSIIAGNTAASNPDFTAPFDPTTAPGSNLEVRFSLIGNNAGTTRTAAATADANGNLIGTPAALIDPKLGPLQNNGGTTFTHALLADSPALDAADQLLSTAVISTDQRGVTRIIDLPNIVNPAGKTGLDIGAVEMVGVSIADVTASESAGTLNFSITLSRAIPAGLTVTVRVDSAAIVGGATAGVDYTAIANQTITFTSTDPLTKTVSVTIANDSLDEPNETFRVNLSNASGAIITKASAIGTITDDDEPADFGDAPSRYPVTLADNGARHEIGNLFFGATVDAEIDGAPSADASGDGGDDGVFALTTLLSSTTVVTSSVSVIASGPGKLDGWIDFNGDGDWLDAGEQIFTSTNVVAGSNLLSFSIPAGATSGSTAARFRISTAGGLAPTGPAVNGEVEDYLMTIVNGSSTAKIELEAPSGETELSVEGADLVMRRGTVVIFKAPITSFGELNLNGSELDDVLKVSVPASLASKKLVFDGGLGKDRLELGQSGQTLDFSGTNSLVRDIETMDIRGTGGNTLIVNLDSVKALSSASDTLEVLSDNDDTIVLGAGWLADLPRILNGQFTHILSEAAAGGTGRIEIRNNRFMQNPLNRFDVDRDGFIRPLDALQIINAVRRRGNGPFVLPTTDDKISRFYFDVSGTNDLTPLEALLVMNAIRRRVPGTGESPITTASTLPRVVDLAKGAALDSWTVIDSTPWLQQSLSSLVETRSAIANDATSSAVDTIAPIARQLAIKPTTGKWTPMSQPSSPQSGIEATDEWFAELGQEDEVPSQIE